MIAVRLAAAAVTVLALGGCNFWIAGHTADYRLIVHGKGVVDVSTGDNSAELALDGTDLTCKAQGRLVHKTGGVIGDRGAMDIVCSDGRKGKGESLTTSMEGGTGSGEDECGNAFQFVWGINHAAISEALADYRAKAKARNAQFADKCDAPGDAPPHRDPIV